MQSKGAETTGPDNAFGLCRLTQLLAVENLDMLANSMAPAGILPSAIDHQHAPRWNLVNLANVACRSRCGAPRASFEVNRPRKPCRGQFAQAS